MPRKIVKMKSNAKSKTIILLTIGILFALLPVITTNLRFITGNSNKRAEYSDDINLDNKNLKLSKISERIHIDNNWTAAKAAGICTGEGTYSDPYVIEDLEIDGGGSGSCIWIENSIVYFMIKNCILYNAIYSSNAAGINLWNASNGYVVDNQANDNGYIGINLISSNNNTILRNDACSQGIGIVLQHSHNNLIKGNTFNKNSADASLFLIYSDNNNISENNVIYNKNYGVFLSGSYDNTISGNTVNSNNFSGISLYGSDKNTISGNTVNSNTYNGIHIERSDRNIISFNTITLSSVGIYLRISNSNEISNNLFSDNGVDIKIETEDFSLLIVIIIVISTVIITIVIILIRRRSKSEVVRYKKLKELEGKSTHNHDEFLDEIET